MSLELLDTMKSLRFSSEEIEDHQRSLEMLARQLVFTPQDAEDAIQDVWLEILERPPKNLARFSGWLRVVMIHSASKIAQRDRRRAERERIVAQPEREPSFLENLERRSLCNYLVGHVEALEDPYREVVRLRYIEGLELPEIAQRLARPEGTVRSQLKRGLDKLRERFASRVGEGRGSFQLPAWLAWLRPGKGGSLETSPSSAMAGIGLSAFGCIALVLIGLGLFEREPRNTGVEPTLRTASLSGSIGSLDEADPLPNRAPLETVDLPEEVLVEPSLPRVIPSRDLEGIVIDETGSAVADAEIFLSPAERPGQGAHATTTDEDGRFRLASVPADRYVYADMDGFDASPLHLVDSIETDKRLELHLGYEVGKLTGRVISWDGEPIPGAKLCVLPRTSFEPVQGPQRTIELLRTPRTYWADDEGSFEFDKLPTPRCRIVAMADGFAPRQRFLSLGGAATTKELEIKLPLPLALDGRVVSEDGAPVAGALLRVHLPAPLEPRHARTDGDGRFNVTPLPPGPFALVADPDGGAAASCVLQGELERGENLSLGELVLTQEWSVCGRATDGSVPLVGWRVALESVHESSESNDAMGLNAPRETRTDEHGEFTFAGCLEGDYHVRLLAPENGTAAYAHALVAPGCDPVALVATPETRPSATVHGRIQLTEDTDFPRITLAGAGLARDLDLFVDTESGGFASGSLAPGTYELRAYVPSLGAWSLALFDLGVREERDLGTLAVPRPGAIQLRFEPEGDLAFDELRLSLFSEGQRLHATPEKPGQGVTFDELGVTIRQLLPGTYEYSLKGGGLADAFGELHVTEGATTVESVPLRRGIPIFIKIQAPRELEVGEELFVTIDNASGSKRLVTPNRVAPDDTRSLLQFNLLLPEEPHRIRIESTGGLHGEVSLEAEDFIPLERQGKDVQRAFLMRLDEPQ